MLISQTPDNQMKDTKLQLTVNAIDKDFKNTTILTESVDTVKGKAMVNIKPPDSAVALTIDCGNNESHAYKADDLRLFADLELHSRRAVE